MTYAPLNFTVWTEIPVSDLDRAAEFYGAVTLGELERMDMGPNPTMVFKTGDPGTGVAAHLYPGKPAAEGQGPTIHLAAPGTAEEIMERVTRAGGKVLSPVIEIPEGRFAYCQDLDGNSVSFFQAA